MVDTPFPTTPPHDIGTTISDVVNRLKALTQRSHQPEWHFSLAPLTPAAVLNQSDWPRWAIAPRNPKDHIPWQRGQRPIWLCQQIIVPENLNGFPLEGLTLRLGLTWWAEAVAVYVNGHLVQEGDLFDCFARILLSDRVRPGDTFTIAIYMVSPGHDDGALVRTAAIYESADPEFPEPGFVADELTVLKTYAETLAPEKSAEIAAAIAPLDWSTVSDRDAFRQELANLRARLLPLSDWIKQRQITCVGHAHLDLAWLWPVEDTWRAAERTFRSVLSLQAAFPDLTYTHSSPALFEWLETHQPELFQDIFAAVKQGSWSIDAGLWVEPELNTIGGESLARQILYGQRYSRSRFGEASAIAWLPDSFGFSWQLPQLLKLGGITYFATQKLCWNETTTFPHRLFWWQGLDGTQLLSLTLPPIGTDIDPAQIATHSAQWEAQTHLTEMLWLPGMGDHGGGPTRDMLETAHRWANSPFFPKLTFDSPCQHLQRLTAAIAQPPNQSANQPPLPIWNDELYLELHRGCYTVHADQKWYNRRCEDTLREAELFAALAHMQGTFDYPRAALESAWKQVLFNQFHDILPGTAIPEVFATTNPEWQQAYDTASAIRAEALGAIADQLPLPHPPQANAVPVFVFNSLNWEQTQIVEVDLSRLPTDTDIESWQVFDPLSGKYLTTQISQHIDPRETPPCQSDSYAPSSSHLLFTATIPPIGFCLYWLIPNPSPFPHSALRIPHSEFHTPHSNFQLENELIQAVIDPQTGDLTTLLEKSSQQNLVRSPANQLQAFRDSGQYWDAWDIAPDYQNHPLPAAQLTSIEWLETGPLRQRLRVIRQIADSTLQQDYVLDHHLPYLKVVTVADWQANQVVLKASFPLACESDQATYEIPFGAIARPTNPTTPHEQAKWEVPAYRWADLSDGERGLSILTDYKHGFDAQPDQLRLTLLKAPLWPDPHADRGRHQFTYALYPHRGNWRTAKTPNWAIAFNTELPTIVGTARQDKKTVNPPSRAKSPLPLAQGSFLNWQTAGTHLAALKLSEDVDDHYILRFWEMYGHGAGLITDNRPLQRTNLLETAMASDRPTDLAPWEIATFQVPTFINKSLRILSPSEPQH